MGNYLKYKKGVFYNKIGGGIPKVSRARNSREELISNANNWQVSIIEAGPDARAIDCGHLFAGFQSKELFEFTQTSKWYEFVLRDAPDDHGITILQMSDTHLIFKNRTGCSWSDVFFDTSQELDEFMNDILKNVIIAKHELLYLEDGFPEWVKMVYKKWDQRDNKKYESNKWPEQWQNELDNTAFYIDCGLPLSDQLEKDELDATVAPVGGHSSVYMMRVQKSLNLLDKRNFKSDIYLSRKNGLCPGVCQETIQDQKYVVEEIDSRGFITLR
jgi:hypothetical protein